MSMGEDTILHHDAVCSLPSQGGAIELGIIQDRTATTILLFAPVVRVVSGVITQLSEKRMQARLNIWLKTDKELMSYTCFHPRHM